ncbi:hypothetical protein SteCoe_32215 [Stentor coeruleus]|uniref:RING-type domain-containing protein n=1 Tax=Stentor coeruleus TaxID=5963 RepID=A0A1R2AZW7_9CILI|nr:hypothetical protein SteCoe_32215 [Stentor coeruleus]
MLDLVVNHFEFPELPTMDAYSGEELYQYGLPIKDRPRNAYRKNQRQNYFIEIGNFHNFNQNNIHKKAKNNNNNPPILIPIEKILIKEYINKPNENFNKIQNAERLIEKLEKPPLNIEEIKIDEETKQSKLSEKIQELSQGNENFNYLANGDKHTEVQKDEEFSKRFLEEMPFNEVESFDPFSIKCQICLSKNEDYHNLGCKDNFCTPCIYLLLENYITASYVFPEELLCPLCLSIIPDQLISKLSSESLYNKMLQLREKYKIQKLVADKKALYCPITICEGFGYLLPDEKITACTKCKCSICTNCYKIVHPCITCLEAANALEDSLIENLILSQNWKKCSNCGAFVEKIDGCQFVRCCSSLCKGVNALCYLCGKTLIEAQHYSHYKLKGPFGNTCNTLDGIDEEIVINAPDQNVQVNDLDPDDCNIF